MRALNLDTELRWGPKQWEALQFARRPEIKPGDLSVMFVGGDYGGGKSFVAGAAFIDLVMANPFIPGVHSVGDEPLTGIVGPTLGDLKNGPLVQLFKIVPEELIWKVRLYGEHQDIHWINGHRTRLYSAEGAMNGPTLCGLWVDEFQERCYAGKWDNIQGRVRDRRSSRPGIIVTGIAQRGSHVEGTFGGLRTKVREHLWREVREGRDEGGQVYRHHWMTVLLFPEDNRVNLMAGYADALKGSQRAARKRDKEGWLMQIDGAMYPEWSRSRHVRELATMEELLKRPTSLSLDFGRSAAAVFLQPIDVRLRSGQVDRGVYIVDEWMPRDVDAEKMADHLRRTSPWRMVPGVSKIFLDPTAATDQVRHFQRAFPGVEVVQVHRGFYHQEENGVRAVARALEDLAGDVRLYVHPRLAVPDRERDPDTRGTVEMFGNYLEKKPKDKLYEHASDVVRYGTQHFCPLPMLSAQGQDDERRARQRMERAIATIKESELF